VYTDKKVMASKTGLIIEAKKMKIWILVDEAVPAA
jgi:hypothetical protein